MNAEWDGRELDVIGLGDCVMDCISYVERLPKMGETMMSRDFLCTPGGKGTNPIAASSRLGSKCSLISKLGDDFFGANFLNILKADGVDTQHVTLTKTASTSVASILVDENGQNAIVGNYGATAEICTRDVDEAEETIKKSKIFVTSMIIKDVALHALKVAKKHSLLTIFNFSPAVGDLNQEFNEYVDLLVVNEIEAEVFTGRAVKTVEDAKRACATVLERQGFHLGVIVTLGEQGAVFGDRKSAQFTFVPAKKVQAVDTTGAGDAFLGSLAHYICKLGVSELPKAIEKACDYATMSVMGRGTQASYPKLTATD